jgi:hypothetical protein
MEGIDIKFLKEQFDQDFVTIEIVKVLNVHELQIISKNKRYILKSAIFTKRGQ